VKHSISTRSIIIVLLIMLHNIKVLFTGVKNGSQ